jgi:cyclopropane-fatty-acyl-phospholipid synthase
MFEHVGEALLPEYFKRAWQLLRAGGAFLNSGIASTSPHSHHDGPSFIDATCSEMENWSPLHVSIRVAEASGFEVRDVESMREHYAMTFHQWVGRLEDCAGRARLPTGFGDSTCPDRNTNSVPGSLTCSRRCWQSPCMGTAACR